MSFLIVHNANKMCGIYVALIEFFRFSYFSSIQLTSINLAPTLAQGVYFMIQLTARPHIGSFLWNIKDCWTNNMWHLLDFSNFFNSTKVNLHQNFYLRLSPVKLTFKVDFCKTFKGVFFWTEYQVFINLWLSGKRLRRF